MTRTGNGPGMNGDDVIGALGRITAGAEPPMPDLVTGAVTRGGWLRRRRQARTGMGAAGMVTLVILGVAAAHGGGMRAAPGPAVGPSTRTSQSAGLDSALLAIPAGVSVADRGQYVLVNALAVCMRGKGFPYRPRVSTSNRADLIGGGPDGADYALAKVGLVAGMYPSLRAARLEPVDALRTGS